MPVELRCRRLDSDGVAVLRVAGVLTRSTAPHLRTALLKCLADQPHAVVVDVAAMSASDDVPLTLFIAAARQAAAWPAVPLILASPTPPVAAALERMGLDEHVELAGSLEAALVESKARDLPQRVRESFPPVAGAAAAARRLISHACARWGLDHLAPDAALVASELVTNAVVHARTPIELVVTRGRRHLHVAVRDLDPRPARVVGPDTETAPGGRGMLLVDAVAPAWGHTPTNDGKVTWASLPARQGRL